MRDVVTVREMIYRYAGDAWLPGVFLIGIFFLYLAADGRMKKYIALYAAGGALLLTPVFQEIIKGLGGDAERYRFLWLFPVTLVVAGIAVGILAKQRNQREGIGLAVALLIVLYFAGNTYLKPENLQLPENIYGLPDDVLEVSRIMEGDKDKVYVTAALDYQMELTLRQYDASVIWAISMNTYFGGVVAEDGWMILSDVQQAEQLLMRFLEYGEYFDESIMRSCLETKAVDYLVVKEEMNAEGYLEDVGCVKVGESENYEVYRVERVE